MKSAALDTKLIQLCDMTIASILFIAPLAMGGRHPVGRLILACLISFAALCLISGKLLQPGGSRKFANLGPCWLAILGCLIVLSQLVPWHPWLLEAFSPGLYEYLPSSWRCLSVAPNATKSGLAIAIIYTTFLLVLWQRIDSQAQVEKLLRMLAYSIVWLACLGLVQMLLGNGKFLWLYEHPSRNTIGVAHGPFQNQNHFGQMPSSSSFR